MTLTIELPDSVRERAAGWSKEALAEVAVNAVVRRLLDEPADDEPIGAFGPVTEEIPMDEATFAALKEARADYDAGRFYTLEEADAHLDVTLDNWKATRDAAK